MSRAVLLLVVLGAIVARSQKCTMSDVRYMFSPCKDGIMDSIQYFERLCDNSNGSVPVKEPRPAPCVKSCPSGTFYSPETVDCKACKVGEFSNSGGEIINTFETFPSRFATYCNPQPCLPWQISDGKVSIDSGNQTSVGVRHSAWYNSADESVEVTLVTIIDVINPNGGKLIFRYRVESERLFDGLQLYFNGTLVKNKDDPSVGTDRFFATGLHHQWRRAKIALPVGRVEVKFVYTKDSNQNSEAGKFSGSDRAYLKDFVIEGVQMFAPHCTACAPGEFADSEGLKECQTCSRNSFSTAGAQGCLLCPSTQWAPVGSAQCFPKVACVAGDYVASYGACSIDPSSPTSTPQRQREWKLINTRCILNADNVPLSGPVPCEICPSGFHMSSTYTCEPCPSGQMWDKVANQCTSCPPGKAAVPIVDYSQGFDTLKGTLNADVFPMSCEGVCEDCPSGSSWCTADGTGFELAPFQNKDEDNTIVGIRQTLANGNVFTSKLTYRFHLVTDGSVSLSYWFVRQGSGTGPVPVSLTATITIGGVETLLDKYYVGPDGPKGIINQDLKGPGDYELVYTVSQSGYIAADDIFAVVLLSMKVVGDDRGAAGECTSCTPGHYCPGNTNNFIPCPLGTSQYSSGAASCTPCSGNSIAKETGRKSCTTCNYGTDVSADHKFCVNRCNVTYAGNMYDFTDLRGQVFGPLFLPGARTDLTQDEMDLANQHRFFISPCSIVNQDKTQDKCSFQYGSLVEDAYACQRLNANRSYSIGDDIRYQYLWNSQQLTMFISGGDRCIRANTERRTNITFVCDASQEGYGTMQFAGEGPECQYNFVYTSKYGCPVCTPESYSKVETTCDKSGYMGTQYFKRPFAQNCQGGYVPPQSVNKSCDRCQASYYDAVWSDCVNGVQTQSYVIKKQHAGCVDDGSLVMPAVITQQACSKIDAKIGANGFTLAMLATVAAISLMFYALYTLYHKHTRLQVEYQRLSTNAGEMAEMDDDDDALEHHNQTTVEDK